MPRDTEKSLHPKTVYTASKNLDGTLESVKAREERNIVKPGRFCLYTLRLEEAKRYSKNLFISDSYLQVCKDVRTSPSHRAQGRELAT
jgi:hypothetical protein